mmetsp:Transcript_34435/g.71703  ORF Transcript_34435/g.71703 Transcript_34435/m.71703 type:complete len:197 (-) Transcript_34435:170-760(-)
MPAPAISINIYDAAPNPIRSKRLAAANSARIVIDEFGRLSRLTPSALINLQLVPSPYHQTSTRKTTVIMKISLSAVFLVLSSLASTTMMVSASTTPVENNGNIRGSSVGERRIPPKDKFVDSEEVIQKFCVEDYPGVCEGAAVECCALLIVEGSYKDFAKCAINFVKDFDDGVVTNQDVAGLKQFLKKTEYSPCGN